MGRREVKRKNPPHVHEYTNRHGTVVFYYRRAGGKKFRIKIEPGVLPWSPTFMAAYEQAKIEAAPLVHGAKRLVAGTVAAALVSYYQSPAFKALAEGTQKSRRNILEKFRKDHGDKPVSLMHSTALQNIINKKTAAAQKNFKKALRGFIDHAIALKMIKVDPLASLVFLKAKKSNGFHTWSEDEVAQFKAKHAPGTKPRLAMELLLNTGHARADVVRMGRQHVKSGTLSMCRKKTGVAFDIPLLPELVKELELHSADQLFYLTTEYGKPFTAAGFGNWFRDRCDEAGLPQCSAHGLRKAAAVRHALKGATAPMLMAWFGWKTIGEAQRYIEEANRIKLAEMAGDIMRTEIGSPAAGEPIRQ